MPLNLLIVIEPKQGKEQRVDEVLAWLVKEIEAKEPDVTVYQIRSTEDYKKGVKTSIVHMQITDEAALEARGQLPHHQEITKILKEEGLLTELKYMRMSGAGGFIRAPPS
ncbi:hypothetical protein LTR86_001902 [Recurvomyces mirabilis]|nr:hypothetical protein LTR86_001902 [Recurvomyces mirabilis]